ncbi:MAG: hypothetical protein GF383_08795 [Candidatus Lokiarchaeota archaeon]|nr:hypothetical protein [Candidatus Lokiarchaeota archaeon]
MNPSLFADLIKINDDLRKVFKKAILYHLYLNVTKLLEIRKDLKKRSVTLLKTEDLKKTLNVESLIEIFDRWNTLPKNNLNTIHNLS